MSDHTSLLKARYCHSIMKTAVSGDDEVARRLIDCLTSEIATAGTSSQVAGAERDAMAAIVLLSGRLHGRSLSSVATEWRQAADAVVRWIDLAGQSRPAQQASTAWSPGAPH